MKEPYGEGLTNHLGPELCAGDGNIMGEAFGRGIRRLSYRAPKSPFGSADPVLIREGNIARRVFVSDGWTPRSRWN